MTSWRNSLPYTCAKESRRNVAKLCRLNNEKKREGTRLECPTVPRVSSEKERAPGLPGGGKELFLPLWRRELIQKETNLDTLTVVQTIRLIYFLSCRGGLLFCRRWSVWHFRHVPHITVVCVWFLGRCPMSSMQLTGQSWWVLDINGSRQAAQNSSRILKEIPCCKGYIDCCSNGPINLLVCLAAAIHFFVGSEA